MNADNRGVKCLVTALLLWLACAPLAQAFYNPSTGRWLSRDPISETGAQRTFAFNAVPLKQRQDELNQYLFVQNDGLRNVDKLGLSTIRYSCTSINPDGIHTFTCNINFVFSPRSCNPVLLPPCLLLAKSSMDEGCLLGSYDLFDLGCQLAGKCFSKYGH